METFPYTLDNKRYHTYNYFLRNKYHGKIAKISLNADFTCPNRDGKKAYGGCSFCSSKGSGDFAGNVKDDLIKQYETQKKIMQIKWPDAKFIAYFQAFTNTYAPLEVLKERFETFLNMDDIVAIAIATRSDCIDEEIVKYLASLNEKIDIYIELGLQTIHDQTSVLLNRQETFEEFKQGLALLNKYHLPVGVHIMNGLPYETIEMMLETAKTVGQLNIQALKIHSLYLTEDTKLYHDYLKNPFPLLSREEYIQLVCNQLRYIPSHVVIERLTGDAPLHLKMLPDWSRNKTTILNDIDKYMKNQGIFQGDLITSS